MRQLFTKTTSRSADSCTRWTVSLVLTIFYCCTQNSFGQFITDENHDFHDEIKSVLDSAHYKEYAKIDFTGVYKERLFGKIYCRMSFTFLNDSILSYKESYREFYQWHTENSTYYVRKYGWYFKSDIHGNIILKNNPPYSVSARDSSGYLIVIDTDSVDGNVNKAVYNPKRKPVEYTSSMGSSQFIQTYKYQYKGDTTIEQIITNYGNKVVPSDAKKIVTNKIIKKKKVIIKEEVVYAKFQEENQTSFRIKKYNKNKELIQIKLGNTGRKNLFQIFIPDHLNIRYYRNID